jgi:ParB-like chromosome segregation protein Spo0J
MSELTAKRNEIWHIDKLIPFAKNSRTHSDEQVAQIAASIKEWGWTTPVLIDPDGMIVAGHGRILAARKLGITDIPVVVADGWTDAQKRAYVIADNKLALNAGWDDELLRIELGELGDLGFDLDLIGFDAGELASIQFDGDEVDMPELNDGDKEPFQQKTFTLHDEQAEVVDKAIMLARTNPLADTGLNENTNGNGLALICYQWMEARNGKR